MKKYLIILKTTLDDSLQYVGSIVLKFLSQAMMLFVLISLWKHIYQDPSKIINGFTYTMTLWYIVIAECLYTNSKSRDLTSRITEDIAGGSIAYKLNKPYFYPLYVLSYGIGSMGVKAIITSLLSILVGIGLIGKLESFNPVFLPLMIVTLVLGWLIQIIFRITILLTSFWLEDVAPFMWLFDKIMLVLGTTFPIDMFSKNMQGILKFLPIYPCIYGPSKLIVSFELGFFKEVLIYQIFELILISIICAVVYRKGAEKINVYGG